MRLTLALPDERIISIDISIDITFSALKSLISAKSSLSESDIILMKDGDLLNGNSIDPIRNLNLKDGDLIAVVNRTSNNSDCLPIDFSSINIPTSYNPHSSIAETARQFLLKSSQQQIALLRERNPEFVENMHDAEAFSRVFDNHQNRVKNNLQELQQLGVADQLNPGIQQRIAELIQQRNIDQEMETALEFYPETFGQVTMLYISCKVQGEPVKAFVDSGAQTTIMSLECARRCNLERLIDKRWAGMAYGVGTQTIIGRIHQGHLEIGGIILPTSFVILKDQPMDLMIGLDMLKRHQCCIDLNRNVLSIGGRVNAPFLPESELPLFASNPELLMNIQPGTSAKRPHQNVSAPIERLTDDQEVKITLLTSENVPREQAIEALRACSWDVETARALYFRQN